MSIALIAAVARNNVIGNKQDIPWRIPEDWAYFKRVTSGHTILMGRKTFESLGKPLPNRKHLVITRDTAYTVPEGVEVYPSIEAAIAAHASENIFVIGGGEIYRQTIDRANTLYITHIDREVEGDTVFPEIDTNKWHEVSREDHDGFAFTKYDRNKEIRK